MLFKDQIKEARLNMGLSKSELADMLGEERKTISAWEKGSLKIPDEQVLKLLKLFNIPLSSYLASMEEEKNFSKASDFMPSIAKSQYASEVNEEILWSGKPCVDFSKRVRKQTNFLAGLLIFLGLALLAIGLILFGFKVITIIFLVGTFILTGVGLYLIIGKYSHADFEIKYYVTKTRLVRENIFKVGSPKRYEVLYEQLRFIHLKKDKKGYQHLYFDFKDKSASSGQYFYSLNYLDEAEKVLDLIQKAWQQKQET